MLDVFALGFLAGLLVAAAWHRRREQAWRRRMRDLLSRRR